MTKFFLWLRTQQHRSDDVGRYAYAAVRNHIYPRSSDLNVLLRYEPHETRRLLKRVHREWRRSSAEQRHDA